MAFVSATEINTSFEIPIHHITVFATQIIKKIATVFANLAKTTKCLMRVASAAIVFKMNIMKMVSVYRVVTAKSL